MGRSFMRWIGIRDGPIKICQLSVPAALALMNYRYAPLDVIVDGKEIFASAPAMAFVANISELRNGIPGGAGCAAG